ncbi:MAG: sensor domain-containing diguanylate cyclase [Sulfurimonas sp.]
MISKKVFFNPKIILPLTFLLLVNLTVALTAYLYTSKNKELSYSQAFDSLQAINNIKEHKLQLFFKYRFKDISALAHNLSIVEISQNAKNSIAENSYISTFLDQYEYSDLLLLDQKKLKIIFSATNKGLVDQKIDSQTFQNSNITSLIKKVIDTNQSHITDTEFSVFSQDEPYLLMAAPVKKDDKLLSILLLVLPGSAFSELIDYREGMGKSGESYIVGGDHLLRSDVKLKKTLTVKNSFLEPHKYKVKTKAVDEAIRGNTSHALIKDYRGVNVLSVYKPFNLDSLHWALISEIDESELQEHYFNLRSNIILWSIFISFTITLFGYMLIMKILGFSVLEPLRRSYKHAKGFEEVIDKSLNEIYIFDPVTLLFTYVNRAAVQNCGYSYDEFLGMNPIDIKPDINKDLFYQIIKPLLKKELNQIVFETRHERKDGTTYDAEIRLQLMDIDGSEKFVAFIHDITKRNEAIQEKEKLYNKATHDYLTKIYNRQMFDEIYLREFNSYARYQTPASLILFDIDNFKNVNDQFGHDIGDKVLIELVNIVKKHVRSSDTFARWGGEEFVILMHETDLNEAYEKAEEIRKRIEKHTLEEVGTITCSFGVATLNDPNDENAIFKNADDALYLAKRNGKNCVEKDVIT